MDGATQIERAPWSWEGVVFTGRFDRIDMGLSLLRKGQIDRLVISGVNGGAGLYMEKFARQFGLSQTDLDGLIQSGRLAIGAQANNTLQNAWETRSMLAMNPPAELLLITGECHMPRASLLLGGVLGNVKIKRLPISGDCKTASAAGIEFFKYLYSFAYFLGNRIWPAWP